MTNNYGVCDDLHKKARLFFLCYVAIFSIFPSRGRSHTKIKFTTLSSRCFFSLQLQDENLNPNPKIGSKKTLKKTDKDELEITPPKIEKQSRLSEILAPKTNFNTKIEKQKNPSDDFRNPSKILRS